MNAFDLEQVHDAEIVPRMMEIIELCKQHGIPMLASFCYRHGSEEDAEEDFYSTTFIKRPADGSDKFGCPPEFEEALAVIRNGADTRFKTAAFIIKESLRVGVDGTTPVQPEPPAPEPAKPQPPEVQGGVEIYP